MADREFYIDLARRGLTMPIGTHLVLHEAVDVDAVLHDGEALGRVVEAAAQRWRTPLAVPLMDLQIEKAAIAAATGVQPEAIDSFHLVAAPTDETIAAVRQRIANRPTPRIVATCDALRYIASQTDLLPIGMGIGPFSLMTKLLADPITPVCMAGMGIAAEADAEVAMVEAALALATATVTAYFEAQLAAGAQAVIVCEPAANVHYLSPNQLAAGSDIFERYVMQPNLVVKRTLEAGHADLIFHDCGELTDAMVEQFGRLDPAILSLGSSRVLWEDAKSVPPRTVLYGNLPSKRFYSDTQLSQDGVRAMADELRRRMAALDRPFILGTECDVLSVAGCEETIRSKVEVMMSEAGAPPVSPMPNRT